MKKKFFMMMIATLGLSVMDASAKQWTLRGCIDYALEHNISLQKTRLTKASAEEDILSSKAAFLPSLSASTSQNLGYSPWRDGAVSTVANGQAVSSVDKVYYNGSYGVNANWTVWDGHQRSNTLKLNQLASQMAELDSAQTANSIQEQIVQLYVQILYTTEAVEVNKQSLETSKKNEERGKTMVEVGKMSKADLAQLTAQVAQDQYSIVEQESNLRGYKRQLKQLLQITDEEDFDVAVPSTTDEQALADIPAMRSVYEAALLSRPEIENAKLDIEQSKLNVSIAKAGILPTVGLNGSVGTSTNSMSSNSWGNQMKTNFDMGAGVTLSIPLFDQRKTKTAVRKAEIAQQTSQLELQNQQTELWSTIEQYWLDATTNQNKFKAAKVNTESAQASYDLLSEQFRLGLKNIVELMTGKDNLLSAKQSELQSKYMTILNQQMLKFYKGEDMAI